MFKKLFITAAGLILSSNAVLAQANYPQQQYYPPQNVPQAAPQEDSNQTTFRGDVNGTAVTVILAPLDSGIGGVLITGDSRFVLAGRFDGQRINGLVDVNGNRVQFQATLTRNQLIMTVNGVDMRLDRVGGQPSVPAPAPEVQFDLPQAPVPTTQVPTVIHQISGKSWKYGVPSKWEASESDSGVAVSNSDKSMGFGVVGFVRPQAATPKELAQSFLQSAGATQIQVLSSTPKIARNGDEGLELEVAITGRNGQPRHVFMRTAIMKGSGTPVGIINYSSCRADLWETNGQTLCDLMKAIRPADMGSEPQITPAMQPVSSPVRPASEPPVTQVRNPLDDTEMNQPVVRN